MTAGPGHRKRWSGRGAERNTRGRTTPAPVGPQAALRPRYRQPESREITVDHNHTGCGEECRDTTYSPYYGQAVYTHAGGIDQPLALTRSGLGVDRVLYGPTTVRPHANWQHAYNSGTYTNGQTTSSSFGTTLQIAWPGTSMQAYRQINRSTEPPSWMGSLIGEQTDASGQQYKRNRYYDPVTGRFTQEDPIGLAGGVNAYGFAGGDPVSYSDPFGLCPECNDDGAPDWGSLAKEWLQERAACSQI